MQYSNNKTTLYFFPVAFFTWLLLAPLSLKAVGTFIPVTNRVDMVHDAARNVLYITSGSTIFRYHLGSNSFMTPFQLSGTLRGIDISPNGNQLAVADSVRAETNVWIHLVDLTTGDSTRAMFTRVSDEGGTFTVAYGSDGAILVSSSYEGSGSVPLRRYDSSSNAVTTIASIRQNSMLTASADGATIAIAESNSSDGPVKKYSVALRSIINQASTSWFNYEVGVSKNGSQFAVPTYGGAFIYNENLVGITNIGVYAGAQPIGVVYHPTADAVFFAWATTQEIKAYNILNWTELGSFNFEHSFSHPGNNAFNQGRLKISRDGAVLFSTVNNGVRYYRHNLNVPEFRRLIVSGNPAQLGYPTSQNYGTNWISLNSNITTQVSSQIETNLARYRCTGWSGTGSVPTNGTTNSVNFVLSENSTLTWNWEATHYKVEFTISGSGSVSVTNHSWYTAGTNAVVTAIPAGGQRFVQWLGDVPAGSSNATLSVTMNQGRRITAVFAPTGSVGTYLTGDWPTFGKGPAHTGYFPGILGGGSFQPKWTSTNSGFTAVADGKVFVVGGGALSALAKQSGQPIWRYTFVPGTLSPPTYDSGAVFVQRGNHGDDTQLWSINATTGTTNWAAPYAEQWESHMAPVVADGKVWINGGYYGGLYGFTQATGTQNFFLSLRQYDGWTPAYYNGRLFTYVGGIFQEHDPLMGTSLWNISIGSESYGAYGATATLVLADNKAFFCVGTNITAVDVVNRQIAWRNQGSFYYFPAVANGVVYAISNMTVRSFTAAGNLIGTYTADTSLSGQPIVTDDALIVSSSSKTYVFDLYNFSLRQTILAGGSLSLADGTLYISGNGLLQAFSSNDDASLFVTGNPVSVGVPWPAFYGTNWFSKNQPLTTSAPSPVETSGVRHRCIGWTGTGSTPTAGTTNIVSFTLATNSTLTWNWEAYEYQLQAVAAGQGTVNVTNQWYAANAIVNITATPQPGFQFDRWNGDVLSANSTNNPLSLTMDRRRNLTAVFVTTNTAPVTGDWPMFGRNPAHTGYAPGILGTNAFKIRWNANVGGSLQQVAVGGGRVFITPYQYFGTAYLAALHEASGQPAWQYSFASAFSINPPSYDGGNVYVQRGNHSGDTHLWNFNASTGGVNWQAPHDAQWERYMSPTIANGNIWVNGGGYGGMYGFSQTNGAQKFFLGLRQYDDWTPAYYNSKLYTYVGGIFQEHDPATGASIWNIPIGNESYGSYGFTATLVLEDNKAFFCAGTNLTAVDVVDRQIAWRNLGNFGQFPAVANGIVYAISNTTVRAFTTSGNLVGTYTADAGLFWQPIITDDALIVSSTSASKTYVFNLSDATLRQTIPAGGYLSLANGILYIATSTDRLYSYSSREDVTLAVSGNPAIGSPLPSAYGTSFYGAGIRLTNSVASPVETNRTRYSCTGWTGSGSVPTSGPSNSLIFTLTTNSLSLGTGRPLIINSSDWSPVLEASMFPMLGMQRAAPP